MAAIFLFAAGHGPAGDPALDHEPSYIIRAGAVASDDDSMVRRLGADGPDRRRSAPLAYFALSGLRRRSASG
ncbi:MAG TPA: hypothetical protein VF463_18700 [Sphingobium sp.]